MIDDKLRYIYNGFEIPYVTLPDDRSLEQVTEIFEKINSSGIQLDVFDLLIARLSKYKIKLRNLWDESLKYPKIKQYEGRKGATKCLFIFYNQLHYALVNPNRVKERIY